MAATPMLELPEPVLVRPLRWQGPDRDDELPPPARDGLGDTLALILAGGRGTRLGPLTTRRAKPAMPVAGRYRLIDFTLSNCVNSGIRRIGVLTQYRADSLVPYLQETWSRYHGSDDDFIECLNPPAATADGPGYLGTADAVYQNLATILAHAPAQVLVLAGDHAYRMDYGAMLAAHRRRGARLTIGCLRVPITEARGFGVMEVDAAQRVCRFVEKPAAPESLPGHDDLALASMGIYIFDTPFLLKLLADDSMNPASSHDFGHDIIPAAIGTRRVFAYGLRDPRNPNRQGYWRDVGTVDAYRYANLELAGESPALDPQDAVWPITVGHPRALRPPLAQRRDRSIISSGCETLDAEICRSVLFPDVHVGPGSLVRDSVVLSGTTIGARCLIRNAVIEEGCRIPAGMVIGVDAERDRARFHVSEGGTVLVTPEMLAAG